MTIQKDFLNNFKNDNERYFALLLFLAFVSPGIERWTT